MANVKDQSTPEGGPGWQRMRARLGGAGMEAMRQDTLARKEAALAEVGTKDAPRTDREGYSGYPAPKANKQRKGRGR